MEHYIGEHLYLSQQTGSYYVDLVKEPYTVIEIVNDKEMVIQEAMCIFKGPRYFDTLPDDIIEDKNGRTRTLKLSKAKKYKDKWISKSYAGDTYPYVAHFGHYVYEPYLD